MDLPAPERTLGETHSPLTRMVVDRLRDRILSGAAAGGDRLVEGRLSEGVALAETGDPVTLMRLNQRFHDALANIAANSVLRDIMSSLRDRTALLFSPLNSGRGKQNWEEHAAILRAVIEGDAELASLLASRHVYNAAHMQA